LHVRFVRAVTVAVSRLRVEAQVTHAGSRTVTAEGRIVGLLHIMKAILIAQIPLRHSGTPTIGNNIEAEPRTKIVPYCRSEARSFFRAMAAECDLPQWHIESSSGRRDLPRGVMAYTTRGGVSAYTVRSTIPVLCRSRSCWESVRCVIPVMERFSSENRLVPRKSCSRTAAFQRPPTMRAVVSMGQSPGRLIISGLATHCIPRIAYVSCIPM
jgi:hypothetical protein